MSAAVSPNICPSVTVRHDMAERDAGVPMLGRDADVTWLVRTLGAAIERGVRGAIVLGEPGIGKTRLLSGVTERLAADGFSAWCGAGTELGQLRPLAPVLEGVQALERGSG